MSIVRIGLGETKNFAEGYDAIFSKKAPAAEPAKPKAKAAAVEEPKAEEVEPKKKKAATKK